MQLSGSTHTGAPRKTREKVFESALTCNSAQILLEIDSFARQLWRVCCAACGLVYTRATTWKQLCKRISGAHLCPDPWRLAILKHAKDLHSRVVAKEQLQAVGRIC